MPAMVAKATPCGSTINAPVSPATRSARVETRSTMCRHRMKGNRRCSQYLRECWMFKMLCSADGLVIKVLRMVCLRKEEPALRQQPEILKYKGNAEQRGSEQTERQQGQRDHERKQQESGFDRTQERRTLAMEELARVERTTHRTHRALHDVRMLHTDGGLHRGFRFEPRVAHQRRAASGKCQQGNDDRPFSEEICLRRRSRSRIARRQDEAGRTTHQDVVD